MQVRHAGRREQGVESGPRSAPRTVVCKHAAWELEFYKRRIDAQETNVADFATPIMPEPSSHLSF